MAVNGTEHSGGFPTGGAVRVERVEVDSDDAQWAMARYFAELAQRFPGGFDPAAGGADGDSARMTPPDGAFVVARRDHDVLGCGGVQRIDATVAEIKRMWVHPQRRGEGLGRLLLDELESIARSLGCSTVVLDTNGSLVEAIAMYERRGYEPTERYNDNPYAQHWFRKTL
jgi:GNAT superfamily N-acetyltransferase